MVVGQDNGDNVQIKYSLEYQYNLTFIGIFALVAFVGIIVIVSILVMIIMQFSIKGQIEKYTVEHQKVG